MTTEIWQLSESELLAESAAVSHQIQLLEARRIALVGEIDTRVSREKLGFPGPAGWLTSTTLLTPSKATKIVALARGLKNFPDIAVDHAALILTLAETPPKDLPQAGQDMARKAMITAATGPEARTDRIREAITNLNDRFGGNKPPPKDTDRNELFASKTLNGRLVLKGDFDAITGEKLLTALSPLTEPQPAADGTEALKIADDRSPARRRADAFGHILDQYLASSNRPTEGGERPHLNLHISLRDLTDLRDSADSSDAHDIADYETSRAADESDAGPTADRGAYRDLFGDGTTVGWLPWMGPLPAIHLDSWRATVSSPPSSWTSTAHRSTSPAPHAPSPPNNAKPSSREITPAPSPAAANPHPGQRHTIFGIGQTAGPPT